MMGEILTQNDEVWWECPVCGWLESGIELAVARYDYDCPGCGCRKLSEFRPVARPKIEAF